LIFALKSYFCRMKILYYLLLSSLLIAGFSNCANDFELTTGATNKPVVYGFLSPTDTATYIRVEKAFVDENTSALELAQRPEELYYDDIEVVFSFQEKTMTLNGGLVSKVRMIFVPSGDLIIERRRSLIYGFSLTMKKRLMETSIIESISPSYLPF